MTKKIFRSILLVSAVVLLASLVVVVACMYRFSADAQERQRHDVLPYDHLRHLYLRRRK